jgi:hypothetical protein
MVHISGSKTKVIITFTFFSLFILDIVKAQDIEPFKWVIKPKYEYISEFSEGLASFLYNEKWGFVDTLGNVIIPAQYPDAHFTQGAGYFFHEGLAAVAFGDTIKGFNIGFIDKKGNIIIAPEFPPRQAHWLLPFFSEGLAAVPTNYKTKSTYNLWGFINKEGVFVIPPILNVCCGTPNFSEGLSLVQVATDTVYNGYSNMNRKSGYINKNGEWIISPRYDYGGNFKNGITEINDFVGSNNYSYYIDNVGKRIDNNDIRVKKYIESNTSDRNNNGSLVPFEVNGLWGYKNSNGKVIVQPIFENASYFQGNFAIIVYNGKQGLLKRNK